ncbi:MAG: hypothetical protein AB7O31_03865 [Burkholderiales bacterium]
MRDLPPSARVPLLVLGVIALASGIAGGLVRLGISAPAPTAGIAWHGALMASAFFGTLISLERAVALGRLWAYAAPIACGAGGIALLAGRSEAAFACFIAGAGLFTAASVVIWLRQRVMHMAVLVLGAAALLVANLALAAGVALESATLGWIAFFALTIGGERLELSRLLRPPPAARTAFVVIALALLLVAFVAPWWTDAALRAAGVLLVALAAWLARYDIASRTVRASGITRYIALCLLAGYVWLALGGAALALGGAGRELWDAAVHALLLGFVFSMVFGHAPVILPAVLRIRFPYHALLYAPLVLLHAALALRVLGDLAGSASLRAAGGAGNAAAIALFIACALGLVLSARRR